MTRDEKQRAIMAINVDLKKWREIKNSIYEVPVLKKGVCYYIPEHYLCYEYKLEFHVEDGEAKCPGCPMSLSGGRCELDGSSMDNNAQTAIDKLEAAKKKVKQK